MPVGAKKRSNSSIYSNLQQFYPGKILMNLMKKTSFFRIVSGSFFNCRNNGGGWDASYSSCYWSCWFLASYFSYRNCMVIHAFNGIIVFRSLSLDAQRLKCSFYDKKAYRQKNAVFSWINVCFSILLFDGRLFCCRSSSPSHIFESLARCYPYRVVFLCYFWNFFCVDCWFWIICCG